MCDRVGRDTKLAKEQARQDQTEQGCGIVGKQLMHGRMAEEMTEESKSSKPDWYDGRENGGIGHKGKGKGKGKSETRYCCDCPEQGHVVRVDQQHK